MSRVLLLVFPSFSEFEITVAMATLRSRFQIDVVSPDGAVVVSEAGLRVMPDSAVSAVDVAEYAAIIVPGGEDLRLVMGEEAVLALIRAMDAQGKVVASICAGGILLAQAGVLAERPYTVGLYRRDRDSLGCFDERYFRNDPVVASGNLITAQGFAFVEFGLCLAHQLGAMSDPEAVRAYYSGAGDIRGDE